MTLSIITVNWCDWLKIISEISPSPPPQSKSGEWIFQDNRPMQASSSEMFFPHSDNADILLVCLLQISLALEKITLILSQIKETLPAKTDKEGEKVKNFISLFHIMFQCDIPNKQIPICQ